MRDVRALTCTIQLSNTEIGLVTSKLSLFDAVIVISQVTGVKRRPLLNDVVSATPRRGFLICIRDRFEILVKTSAVKAVVKVLLLPAFVTVFSETVVHLTSRRKSIPSLLGVKFG